MMNHKPALPPELDAHLREEPDAAELKRVWGLLGELVPSIEDVGQDAAWDRLRAEVLSPPTRTVSRAADHPAVRSSRRRMRRLWVPALAAALTLAGWLYLSTPVTVNAPLGSFATVALPDGSTVELNSGSALEYDRRFWRLPFVEADERTVRLVGEGYFDVEHGERPFVVETMDARVRVLGTAFNVRTRDAGTVVTVTEGRVQVDDPSGAESVVLEAGDRARVVNGVPTTEASGAAQALAWRDRGFAAQEQPLAAILGELERRYALDLTLTATQSSGDTLTLYYPQPTDAETILRDICTARDLNYRQTSRGFEIY